MIRARHVAPLRMRVDDGARVRVGDEAIAELRRRRRIRGLAKPLRDEVGGEGAHGSKLGQAPARFLDGGRFLGPHERRPGRAPERPLFAPLAALGLEREELGDIAVAERRYERKLVGVKKRHVRGGIVEPVGVVRELHRDTHIAALAWATAVDFDEHLAARRRTNVNQ